MSCCRTARSNLVAGLDREAVMTNASRIVAGGILGYVIYLMVPDMFAKLRAPGADSGIPKVLFPLLGGYSISLVIGVIGKAVTAV